MLKKKKITYSELGKKKAAAKLKGQKGQSSKKVGKWSKGKLVNNNQGGMCKLHPPPLEEGG